MKFFDENFWMLMHRRYKLSPRQISIAILSCQAGLSTQEICDKLGIKLNSFRTHKKELHRKLGVNSKFNMLRFFVNEYGKLAALIIVILFCSVCFADCITNWSDFPKGGNLRDYAVFANNWLKVDATCIAREKEFAKLKTDYQTVKKAYALDWRGRIRMILDGRLSTRTIVEVLQHQNKHGKVIIIGEKQ